MDKFLLAENPQIPAGRRKIYIMHTQQPPMLIRVNHEAIAIGSNYDMLSGQYGAETITLQVDALLICDSIISDDLKLKVEKVLSKAWHWYCAYLEWEDENLDNQNIINEN